MGVLNNFSQSLKNFLKPAEKNSMFANLKPFSRFTRNEPLIGDWSQIIMEREDNYKGFSYAAIQVRSNLVYRIAKENVYVEAKPAVLEKIPAGEELSHPYVNFIKYNKNFSEGDFYRLTSTYLDLKGIMYYLVVRNYDSNRTGDIQDIKLLNPYCVQRIINPSTGEVEGYREQRGGLQRDIPKEMVVEVRLPEPFSYNGVYAPTQAAEDHQFALKTAANYQNKSLNKNINSTGIISTDVVFNNEEEYQNWKKKMLEKGRQGEPLFTDGAGNLKYQDMQIDLNRAALKSVHEVNKETMTAIYGTSNTIMGIERSGVTRDTARVQKDIIIQNHIVPRIELILDALNLDYIQHYPEEFEKTQITLACADPTALDNAATSKLIDVKEKQLTIYTRLIGYGYEPTVAGKYANDEIDIDELGEPTRPATTTPRPGRRPANEDEIVEEPDMPNNSFNPSKKKSKELTQKKDGLNCECEAKIDLEKHAYEDERQSQQNLTVGSLLNAIQNLEATVVTEASEKLSESDLDTNFLDYQPLTKTKHNSELRNLAGILAIYYATTLFLEGTRAMASRLEELGLTRGQFNMTPSVRAWIKKMSTEAATSHINTITKDIISAAQIMAKEGKTVFEIRVGLKDLFNEKISEQRAKTIALTESYRVFNEAVFQADLQMVDQNPDLKGRVYKEWITSGGPNVCEFCRQLESEGRIPLDQPFRALGETIEAVETNAEGEMTLKTLPINYSSIYAGSLHPSCLCRYRLIIEEE